MADLASAIMTRESLHGKFVPSTSFATGAMDYGCFTVICIRHGFFENYLGSY
jgi:hypothetical protein